MKRSFKLSAFLAASVVLPHNLYSQETTTYQYDALGRVAETQKSGGPKSGETTSTTYDPAGNRAGYGVNAIAPPPSTASSFQISSGVTLNEGQASHFLSVTRSGSISNAASVSYSSADGSAIASADYNAISGTLNFAAFETQKGIPVNASVDSLTEPVETYIVSLSSPSSGSVVSGGPATVSISANTYTPPSLPPVAQQMSVSLGVCTGTMVTITATDPDNNYPITITAGNSGNYSQITPAGGLQLGVEGFAVGSEQLTYTISDSAGALAIGIIDVTVLNGNGCSRVGGGG